MPDNVLERESRKRWSLPSKSPLCPVVSAELDAAANNHHLGDWSFQRTSPILQAAPSTLF